MRWLLMLLLPFSWLATARAADNAAGTELWYNVHVVEGGGVENDWRQVFQDDAPWPIASNKISVITIGQNWTWTAPVSDVLLETDYAKRHHKKLNMEAMVLATDPGDPCGWGEGYSSMYEVITAMQVLKQNNVRLDWIQMDGPLWYGHYGTAPGNCQYSIAETIARSARFMQAVLDVFPDINIVHAEPLPSLTNQADWREAVTQFRIGLEQQLAHKIRVMHIDMYFDAPNWRSSIQEMDLYLRQQNMQWGIYIDATGNTIGNAAWNAKAIKNLQTLEGTLGLRPIQGIIASWYPYPQNNLPETDPGALTWLVNQYDRPRSLIQVQFQGGGAHGRLMTEQGKAIGNAQIQPVVPGSDLHRPLPVTAITGTVPAAAVQGIFVIRLNTECGGCAGSDDVLLGTMQYQETSGGSQSATYLPPVDTKVYGGGVTMSGLVIGGTQVSRLISPSGWPLTWSSQLFPVTPGATFSFSAPTGTIGGAGWYGNIDVIFLGPNGEISRTAISPDPGVTFLRPVVTNSDGTFTIRSMPRSSLAGRPVSVMFDGGSTYRQVTWSPPHP